MKVEAGKRGGDAAARKRPAAAAAVGVRRGSGGSRAVRPARPQTSAAIQRLFVACKTVFAGAAAGDVPPPAGVELLTRLLDEMKAEDVGLSTDLHYFKAAAPAPAPARGAAPRITCTTIYRCANFSMVIFFLPAGGVIPLHDHPGMTVFSKLLLGSMHIKSFDWADNAGEPPRSGDEPRLARLVADADFTAPCDTGILFPAAGGNMHTFRAITACAVLDVLGPPYSKEDDRDCTYYRDIPCYSSGAGAEGESLYYWLQAIEPPAELKMDCVQYGGPPVVDTLPSASPAVATA